MPRPLHDYFLRLVTTAKFFTTDIADIEAALTGSHRYVAEGFLAEKGRHARFRFHVDRGDRCRDARQRIEGFAAYRAGLDVLPPHGGYFVQAGQCLDELGRFIAAEGYDGSGLILGAPISDVEDHLLHVSQHSQNFLDSGKIRQLAAAAHENWPLLLGTSRRPAEMHRRIAPLALPHGRGFNYNQADTVVLASPEHWTDLRPRSIQSQTGLEPVIDRSISGRLLAQAPPPRLLALADGDHPALRKLPAAGHPPLVCAAPRLPEGATRGIEHVVKADRIVVPSKSAKTALLETVSSPLDRLAGLYRESAVYMHATGCNLEDALPEVYDTIGLDPKVSRQAVTRFGEAAFAAAARTAMTGASHV